MNLYGWFLGTLKSYEKDLRYKKDCLNKAVKKSTVGILKSQKKK